MAEYIPIKLDKMRNLKYGLRAMDRIEKSLGRKFSQIDMNDPSVSDICTVIWAGLVHEDKDLTPDKVMDLIDDYSSVGEVSEAAKKAMDEAFGDEKNQTRAEKNSA